VFDLSLQCTRHDYEIELLVKAIWAGRSVTQVAVTTEHAPVIPLSFRPVRDLSLIFTLNAMLMLQRLLLPKPLLGAIHSKGVADLSPMRRLLRVLKGFFLYDCERPATFAACIGLGVFFGIIPVWGFQMLAAAATAHLLRLSKPLVLLASNISFPAAIPFVLYASLLVGHLLFTGRFTGLPRFNEFEQSVWLEYLGEYLTGSIVLAIAAGIVSAIIAYISAMVFKSLRGGDSC
jgi:uncharacterized protein (DUF2062 family)